VTDANRKLFGVALIVLGIVVVVVAVTHAGASWLLPLAIAAIVVAFAAQRIVRRSR
jgi:hypothetical protein